MHGTLLAGPIIIMAVRPIRKLPSTPAGVVLTNAMEAKLSCGLRSDSRIVMTSGSERGACSQVNSQEPSLTRREQRKREGRSTDHKATTSALWSSAAAAGGSADVDGQDRGDKARGQARRVGGWRCGMFGRSATLKSSFVFSLFLPPARLARLTLARVPDVRIC
jgi:hypothetical protein